MAWTSVSSKRLHQAGASPPRCRRRRGSARSRRRGCRARSGSPARMCARALLLAQLVLRPARDDLALEVEVVREQLEQRERARHAVRRARRCCTPKVDCSGVCLKSLLSATCGTASRFSSIWMRMPERSEWSRRSEISVSTLSLTRSAIFLITPLSPPFFTPYGSSVTMIALLPPRSSSMWARARMTTRPRPVR